MPLTLVASALKEDPRRTDYLVLPVVAGVLAQLVLAVEALQGRDAPSDEVWQELRVMGRLMLGRCTEDQDAQWADEESRYGEVRDFALMAWLAIDFWIPVIYVSWKFDYEGETTEAKLTGVVDTLRTHASDPLTDFTLTAMAGVHLVTTEEDTIPLVARVARKIRVELADRLRRDGLMSWPQIVRVVAAEWANGGAGRFAFELATATREVADRIEFVGVNFEEREAKINAALARLDAAQRRAPEVPVPTVSVAEHEAALRAAESRYRELERRFAAVQNERDLIAERDGRRQSRIDALTERLATAEQRIRELESGEPQAMTVPDESAAPAPDREAVPAIPDDVFAGHRVLVFTGEASGETRDAIARAFSEYGAADITSYWTDKERGPETVPSATIVVIDARFMSHSDSDAIVRMAERSGAWYCVVKRSSSLIAREVATRWLAR